MLGSGALLYAEVGGGVGELVFSFCFVEFGSPNNNSTASHRGNIKTEDERFGRIANVSGVC